MTDNLERTLGKLLATNELMLEEIRDQRKRLAKLEYRVYAWGGALSLITIIVPLIAPVARAMGFGQ
jgi:hypothetical protein